jgi:hypothetical protein
MAYPPREHSTGLITFTEVIVFGSSLGYTMERDAITFGEGGIGPE